MTSPDGHVGGLVDKERERYLLFMVIHVIYKYKNK